MASLEVCCSFCRERSVVASGRKGSAGLLDALRVLYAAGWTGSFDHGRWACSDDCRAYMARDVTPKTGESPALVGAQRRSPPSR